MTRDYPDNNNRVVMTPSEVAELFGCNPKTITRWSRSGRLPSFRTLGGHRRFYASDVEAAMVKANRKT